MAPVLHPVKHGRQKVVESRKHQTYNGDGLDL
jgi:hypothetical protein